MKRWREALLAYHPDKNPRIQDGDVEAKEQAERMTRALVRIREVASRKAHTRSYSDEFAFLRMVRKALRR